jgi:hypothetical protein
MKRVQKGLGNVQCGGSERTRLHIIYHAKSPFRNGDQRLAEFKISENKYSLPILAPGNHLTTVCPLHNLL